MSATKIIAFPVLPPRATRRPPGALPLDQFRETCVGCGDCIEVCPEQVIAIDPLGYPVLKTGGDCALCGLCADVCMHGAIVLTPATRDGLNAVLEDEQDGD
jgi:ferredoxin